MEAKTKCKGRLEQALFRCYYHPVHPLPRPAASSRSPMAARQRPRRSARHRLRHLLLLLPLVLLLLLVLRPLPALLLRRANSLGRRCLPSAVDGLLLLPVRVPGPRLSLAIVTLSDEGAGASPGRSFRGVLAASARNKRAYAAAHGYGVAALSAAAVDTRRPPSWSKVLALRAHLHRHHWLFWNDADTLVTNPDIPLERILFSVIGHSNFDDSPDLILTEDVNGVNADPNGARGS
ncbi:hypothetical protein ACP70R_039294 [Stipagrostis hirtigluma subsp. patula]